MSDIMRDLLAEQERRQALPDHQDDLYTLTRKLLKRLKLDNVAAMTDWSILNPTVVGTPAMWAYIIDRDRTQAVLAITSFLAAFPQKHLTRQMLNEVKSIATILSLQPTALPAADGVPPAPPGVIGIFDKYLAVEPLLENLHNELTYLRTKRVAEQLSLKPRETAELVAEMRGDQDPDGVIEKAARKMRKRDRSHDKRRDRSL